MGVHELGQPSDRLVVQNMRMNWNQIRVYFHHFNRDEFTKLLNLLPLEASFTKFCPIDGTILKIFSVNGSYRLKIAVRCPIFIGHAKRSFSSSRDQWGS